MSNSLRSLYRSILRELPPLSHSRTRFHNHLRSTFSSSSSTSATEKHAAQLAMYLRAQRMYVTLLERYNPGLSGDLDVQEHVRLTARRVGFDMPEEHDGKKPE